MRAIAVLTVLALITPFAADARMIEGASKPTRNSFVNNSDAPSSRSSSSARSSTGSVVMKTYVSEELGLSLEHPSDWEVKEGDNAFWLVPTTDLARAGRRNTEILVMVYEIPQKRDYSIKELNRRYRNNVALNASGLSYSWFMRSFRSIESGDAKLLGHPARRFQYQGYIGADTYRVMQVVTSFDHKLFDVRYRSDPSIYVKDSPIFEAVFKSLKPVEIAGDA